MRHDRERVERIVPAFAMFFLAAALLLTLLAKWLAPEVTEGVLSRLHRQSTSEAREHDSHPMPRSHLDRG